MKTAYVRLESSNLNGGSYWDETHDLLFYQSGLVEELLAFSLENLEVAFILS